MTVLVLGATGRTGRRLVSLLTRRGVTVRTATRAPGASAPGIEPVRFDWSDERTYGPALDGVDACYQVLAPPAADPAEQVAALLAHAEKAGVRRLVHLSNTTAHLLGEDFPMARVERLVASSAVPSTILRPNVFHQNFSENPALAQGVRSGVVAVPAGDARVAPISVEDIAAVAAVALTEGGHEGEAYSLTGPEALSFADMCAIVSTAAGRPVRYVNADPGEFRAGMIEAGAPVHLAGFYASLYDCIRAGQAAEVTSEVARITGRAPTAFADYARAAAPAWR